MTEKRRSEIIARVNEILDKYKITKTPYKFVKEICEKENISLLSAKFSDNVEGLIQNIEDHFYIYYNPNKIETRQHFTIAHELGHYFLGHIGLQGTTYDLEFEFNDKQEIEIEANCFASNILLPEKLIIKDFNDILTYSRTITNPRIPLYITNTGYQYRNWKIITSKLCKKYSVSEEMLSYRLEGLNLIRSNLFNNKIIRGVENAT